MDETVMIDGIAFVSPSACAFGDYGGAGSVGLANIQTLVKEAGDKAVNGYMSSYWQTDDSIVEEVRAGAVLVHLTGGYGSETVYIRADSELGEETIAALADYPCLDDELSSEIEMQWETEAWESWIKSDLERECWPDETPAEIEALTDSDLFECYRAAMEAENEYPEAEYSSVYVHIERIAATYKANVEAKAMAMVSA